MKNYIMISLDDERASKISKVLGNKTCEKIINHLAEEKEASELDISKALHIPINTVEYNLKNLLHSELIEKSPNFFWSQKGKRIVMYKLSNKSIIISPKSRALNKLKSILPTAIAVGIGTLAIKYLTNPFRNIAESSFASSEKVLLVETAQDSVITPTIISTFLSANYLSSLPNWYWFLFGAILAVVILMILNWRKL